MKKVLGQVAELFGFYRLAAFTQMHGECERKVFSSWCRVKHMEGGDWDDFEVTWCLHDLIQVKRDLRHLEIDCWVFEMEGRTFFVSP